MTGCARRFFALGHYEVHGPSTDLRSPVKSSRGCSTATMENSASPGNVTPNKLLCRPFQGQLSDEPLSA
jgi:hypothetical protein